jgi:hypothetical protein
MSYPVPVCAEAVVNHRKQDVLDVRRGVIVVATAKDCELPLGCM